MRRHRLNGVEVGPVKDAVRRHLQSQLKTHDGSIYSAGMLLRVLIRLDDPHTGAYHYPPLSWESIAAYVNGSIPAPLEAEIKERFTEAITP